MRTNGSTTWLPFLVRTKINTPQTRRIGIQSTAKIGIIKIIEIIALFHQAAELPQQLSFIRRKEMHMINDTIQRTLKK
ncbi:hypothetical protein AC781_00730 [Akkermansia glycaniphila]|nr:hypothetical protein AC781_00730 [Akkermansia glycaniphila]